MRAKHLIPILALSGLALAQQALGPQASVAGAMVELCNNAKSLISIAFMICAALSGPSIFIGAGLFLIAKQGDKFKGIGKGLLVLGAALICMSILGVVLYLLTPSLISMLAGGSAAVKC